ncbi:hypothetical protein H4F68_03225 [Rhodococcus globerulus]|nr:hypothetical protein [Rhodococcus globerulus]
MRRCIMIVGLLWGAAMLTGSATLSTSFAVRDGQPSEYWIVTAMTVISVLTLGAVVVFSENKWVRRSSVAALGLLGALGAIANFLLLESPAASSTPPLPDVIRWMIFGTIALAGPATAHAVSIVYRAANESSDRNDTILSEVALAR